MFVYLGAANGSRKPQRDFQMNTMLRCSLVLAASTMVIGLAGCDNGDEIVDVPLRKVNPDQPKIDPDAMPGQDGGSGMSDIEGGDAKKAE